MMKCSTQVPNILFDEYLPKLTESELKILLIIIRQTSGWIDRYTGKRKTRDRISQSQFSLKTGLSVRTISETLKTLSQRGLINITGQNHESLNYSLDRRGKTKLFYSIQDMQPMTSTNANEVPKDMQNVAYNKTKYTKENKTKEKRLPFKTGNGISISEAIRNSGYLRKFGIDNS
ncbi:MAG: replication protein [Saprospiraceae bacterium]|jgi:DNA replication protein DnaD|nr:replication protein [Saprospiraceae bacterium]MBP8892557.1 replication protein [Saprospiraceae bacterium]MBP9209888.1 replication protein [Saprospiraceae bacterium]MBV6472715.1 hypothetical protein [Saprospiraceae bacterium]